MQAGEWLALAGGVPIGAAIGWSLCVLTSPSRRRFETLRRELETTRRRSTQSEGAEAIHLADRLELDRLVTERDEARARAQAAAETAFQAQHEAQVLGDRLGSAERRLDDARHAIHQITARLEVAAAGERPVPARATVDLVTPAVPSAESSAALAHLEAETVRLRRRLADRAVELDRLRNGEHTRAVNDERFRSALDDVTDLWHEHRSRLDLAGGPCDIAGEPGGEPVTGWQP